MKALSTSQTDSSHNGKDDPRDEVAALLPERDLLRASAANARHHKKPYAKRLLRNTAAALNKLGLRLSRSRTSPRVAPATQRYANGYVSCGRSSQEAASSGHRIGLAPTI